ncbi:MAG: hypothetical protein P4N59_13150 [Negativicutes bacterium]|nr:hypothetical protein [Negativicutes bacterium]
MPDTTHRVAIIGRTGSGKTQAGAWFLSQQVGKNYPWIIIDYKRDKLLNDIRAKELAPNASIPTKPDLYIVHPLPNTDDEAVENLLWRIWERGGIGVYVDEGYMIGENNPAFRALLTQGRSKNIPMIVLSQRPVRMDRFVFSEADFYLVFTLNDRKDQQRVQEFLHRDIDLREGQLPKYHAYYHDVSEDERAVLKPVPSATEIKALFRSKVGYKKRLM